MLAFLALAVLTTSPSSVRNGEGGTVRCLATLKPELRDPGESRPISIAPELQNEALYIRGTVGTPATLRALVARATCAEWVVSGSFLRLERSPGLRKRLREAELMTYKSDLRAGRPSAPLPPTLSADEVQRGMKIFTSLQPGDSDAEVQKRNDDVNEAVKILSYRERTGKRIMAAIDLAKLAEATYDIPDGQPVRFLNGSRFLPLPLDDVPILATEGIERSVVEEGMGHAPSRNSAWDLAKARAYAGGRLGLVATRLGSYLNFKVAKVASDGTSVAMTVVDMGPKAPGPDEPLWPGEDPKVDRALKSPVAVAAKTVREGLQNGQDPLHYLARPFLDAYLQDETRPVVLDLPDETIWLRDRGGSSALATSRELRSLVSVELVDGVIVGHPRLPLSVSARRFPRGETKGWIAANSNPDLSLDAAAAIAIRIGTGPIANGFCRVTLEAAGLARAPKHPLFPDLDRLAILRLWSSLPRPTRERLDRGGSIGTATMSAETRRALWTIVLSNFSPLQGFVEFLDRQGEAPLELSWTMDQLPVALTMDGPGIGGVHEGLELGSLIYGQRISPRDEWREDESDLESSRFLPGLRMDRTYRIAFAPDPTPRIEGKLHSFEYERGLGFEWEKLPASILGPLRKGIDPLKTFSERGFQRPLEARPGIEGLSGGGLN